MQHKSNNININCNVGNCKYNHIYIAFEQEGDMLARKTKRIAKYENCTELSEFSN